MGLLWYWLGISGGLLCDFCGIAVVLPWHCCGVAGIAGLVAVMLLWDCRGIVAQILREYCGTAVELVWDNPGIDVGLRRFALVFDVV